MEKERKMFEAIMNSHLGLYVALTEGRKVTTSLQETFKEFYETAEKIYQADPVNFTPEKVWTKIPHNRWMQVYFKHLPLLYQEP